MTAIPVPPCRAWPLKNKRDAQNAAERHKGTLLTMKDDGGDLGYVVQRSNGSVFGPDECDELDRNAAR